MSNQSLNLGEAAGRFLASLSSEERNKRQQEIYRFVRWYGWERAFTGLTAPEVANYAERLSLSDADYAKKLELVRTFLTYARKQGWTGSNLGAHLKTRKGQARPRLQVRHGSPEAISLSQERYTELEAELVALKDKRTQVIVEIRMAAADKDFRENAPLEAARQQRGQLEGRIKELEATLQSATIIGAKQEAVFKVDIGDSVVLRDLVSEEDLCCRIVSPKEVDPTKGKISSESPLGKAAIGRQQGDVVEVETPVGKLRYQIEQITR